jgi:site-specific recombinase XerD
VREILGQPDRSTPAGLRDYAPLVFLYNTGARVSGALALTSADVHGAGLRRPRHVRLHGKGNKDRICPLWPETASALARVIADDGALSGRVFRSARGNPLSRDGVAYLLAKYVTIAAKGMPSLLRQRVTPHVLRHSCAVALLRAGVDVTVIRDYLGQASIGKPPTNSVVVFGSNAGMMSADEGAGRDSVANDVTRPTAGALASARQRRHRLGGGRRHSVGATQRPWQPPSGGA